MPTFSKIVIFVLVNTLGFFSVGILFILGKLSGAIAPDDPSFDAVAFERWFLTGTIMTWVVCALFSFSWFFLKGTAKRVFLWIPAVVPFAYGLSVLFLS